MSSDFPAFEIQQAIYSHLEADTALMARITGVYDEVPEQTEYPYIVLSQQEGRVTSGPYTRRYAVTMEMRIYSRAGGNKEGWEIGDHMIRLLHGHAFAVPGYEVLPCTVEELKTVHGDPQNGRCFILTAQMLMRAL